MATDAMIRQGRAGRILALAWLALFVLIVVAGVAITFLGNPNAGHRVVTMRILAPPERTAKAVPPPTAPQQPPPEAATQPVTAPPPVALPQKITTQQFVGKALIADPSLIENTPDGPLPRIADDGTTPMRAYAPPVISDGRPRIAIVIAGLGISAKATDSAIRNLPAGVTLAFAPYAADVQQWAGEARRVGHEVLLEVPMEPYDFPDSDPGPHTLRSGNGEDSNTERLMWALTRFSGYAGATNLLGDRFLSDPGSLEPMLTYLSRRGLLFFDNGQSAHSAGPEVASRAGVAFAQADTTIDKIQTAMEIDRRLSSLEEIARSRGSASGAGFIYPVTVDRVRNWAAGLAGRGFVLVPASAIVSQSK